MAEVISIWRDSLHTILDLYERKRGRLLLFLPCLFLFFILLNITCYWWAIYTAFPFYMETHEASHYVKLQVPVGFFGALFDSLSFFVTIWIIKRALAAQKTSEYVIHLSLDLFIAILATLWVLLVFTFSGWLISLWENAPEQLADRGVKYTSRAVQAIKDPAGRENIKNIYFGLIMGVSAALPTCFHFFLFFSSLIKKLRKTFLNSSESTDLNHEK
ncbi:MAG: hypothetical protein CBC04_01290 [Verrucomicrobia bacterium TMED44]|nr:MAG: hypothetical protein CBC04_01290 [Verrucomicrobia bacterium TMED44]